MSSRIVENAIGMILGNNVLQEANQPSYHGSKITSDGRSYKEIISRINEAEMTIHKKENLFTSTNISLKVRESLVKACVWKVAVYRSES